MGLQDKINAAFNHAGARKLWCRVRIPTGILVIGLLVPLVQRDWFWIALGISLIGEVVQLWCFASLNKGKELACKGPYACSRNPMYLGRYFIVLGFVALLGEPGLWLLAPYTVFYWFYMRNRVGREEPHLVDALGKDYEDYCLRVNRFMPSLKGDEPKSLVYWNWTLLRKNHGWMNLLALLGVYAALYFMSGLLNP